MEAQEIEVPKAEPKAEAKVLGPIKAARLHFGRVKLANQARRELFADIPAGVDLKMALQPCYRCQIPKL